MARAVVVGAGLAGLCAAVRLGDFGHEVTLVEAGQQPGGQASQLVVDDLPVDLGPSVFTLPAVFRDLFRSTGRPLEREVGLVPVDPAIRWIFPGGTRADLPNASRSGARQALTAAAGPGVAQRWEGLVGQGERIWQTSRARILGHANRPRHTPWRRHGVSRFTDPTIHSMLGAYAAAVGATPETARGAAVLPYLERAFGVWTVDGGLCLLIDALRRRAEERRVRLRLGAAATAVAVDGGRAAGVELGDETVPADVVVWTAHPRSLAGGLRGRGRRLGRFLRRLETPSGETGRSVFSVVAAAPDPPGPAAARVVVLPAGDLPPITLHRGPAAGDSRLWVAHASCAPHGHGRGETDWARPGVAGAQAADVLTALSAAGALAGPVVRAVRTPADLERDLGAPGGRIYGQALRGGVEAVVSRPDNRTPVRGLFLAGAGAHPGPGVAMAGISAAIAADLVGRA